MRRVACSTAVWYLRCGSGRFHARNLRRIIEVRYLRNPKSLPLCGLLIAMSTCLFACGYAGTPPGYHPPPSGNAPTITRQPASVTVTAGQSATFSVAATGTAPLSYQWYVNSAAAGANSSSFTIAAATARADWCTNLCHGDGRGGVGDERDSDFDCECGGDYSSDYATACEHYGDCGAGGGIFGDGDGNRAFDAINGS